MPYQNVSKDNDSQESQYKLSTGSVEIAIILFISYRKVLLVEFNLEFGKYIFFFDLTTFLVLLLAFSSFNTIGARDNLSIL